MKKLVRTLKNAISIASPLLLLCVAAAGHANQFSDRDALGDVLTGALQAPLADAEEALADANAALDGAQQDVVDAEQAKTDAEAAKAAADTALTDAQQAATDAQTALDTAQQALDAGLAANPPLTQEQIDALEADVAEATAARDAADANVTAAQADVTAAEEAVTAAETAITDAHAAVTAAQTDVDEAEANLQAVQAQIEDTEQLVANLSDTQVVALNRSLNNAVHSGLSLDFDLDLLQRIIDEDLGNHEIQTMMTALELEARFDQHAARFEAKAEATGNDRFLDHAARMEEHGDVLRQKFLDRIDVADAVEEAGNDAVHEAAVSEAKHAAHAAVVEAAHEKGNGKKD